MFRSTLKLINNIASKRFLSTSEKPRILITGGLGQLGVALAKKLRTIYGKESVILSDIISASPEVRDSVGKFTFADVLDFKGLQRIVVNENINWLIHLSALLSGVAEQNTSLAIRVNIEGFHNVIELSKQYQLRLFVPSTIAAFGPDSPLEKTPDICVQKPTSLYGVGKVHMERLGEYYHDRFGLDFRCVRLPGIVSYDSTPGGGTTDYAVHIFEQAVTKGRYQCYLEPDTLLPMMYIDDCLNGIVKIMQADESKLKLRTYNINALSFTPKQLAEKIQTHIPNFSMEYSIDFRQKIADTWPKALDDSNAKRDWNWKNDISFDELVNIMLNANLQKK